jgi:hypothetical protein
MGAHNKLVQKKDDEDYYNDTLGLDRLDFAHQTGSGGGDLELEIPIDDPSQVILHKEMLLSVTAPERNVRLNVD